MSRERKAGSDNKVLPRKVFFRPEMTDEEIERLLEQMYENAGLDADAVKRYAKTVPRRAKTRDPRPARAVP